MALGFSRHHAGDAALGWSGGSEPGNQITPGLGPWVLVLRGVLSELIN
jgi:hypothetical protein